MSFGELILLGIGLSMDAIAVTVTNRMVYKNLTKKQLVLIPIFFSVFQALMPAIGFFAGSMFTGVIEKISGILVFIILGAIGGKMVWDGFHTSCEEGDSREQLSLRVLTMQAIATSIDALAVGVGFAAMKVSVVTSCLTIGITTFLLCGIALVLGNRLRSLIGSRTHLFGGVILILIGIKALIP